MSPLDEILRWRELAIANDKSAWRARDVLEKARKELHDLREENKKLRGKVSTASRQGKLFDEGKEP